jgi:hypothetical protein
MNNSTLHKNERNKTRNDQRAGTTVIGGSIALFLCLLITAPTFGGEIPVDDFDPLEALKELKALRQELVSSELARPDLAKRMLKLESKLHYVGINTAKPRKPTALPPIPEDVHTRSEFREALAELRAAEAAHRNRMSDRYDASRRQANAATTDVRAARAVKYWLRVTANERRKGQVVWAGPWKQEAASKPLVTDAHADRARTTVARQQMAAAYKDAKQGTDRSFYELRNAKNKFQRVLIQIRLDRAVAEAQAPFHHVVHVDNSQTVDPDAVIIGSPEYLQMKQEYVTTKFMLLANPQMAQQMAKRLLELESKLNNARPANPRPSATVAHSVSASTLQQP